MSRLLRNRQLLLIGAAVSWGTSAVTSKYALDGLTATDLLGVEVGVATVLLVAAAAARGQLRPSRHWRAYALLAFFEPGLTYALFNTGLAHTSATDAALLVSLESVFTVILAVLFLRERTGPLVVGAAVLGVGGAAFVSAGGDVTGSSVGGNLLVIAAVLTASMFVVLARRVAGRDPALTVTAHQFVFAFLMVLPLALLGHSHLMHASAGHLAAGFATGVLGSAVPFVLYNQAVRSIPASRAAITLNLIPVFGVLAAFAFLGERPGLPQLAGGLLILAAIRLVPAEAEPPELAAVTAKAASGPA
ncbi:MAG TPA: DMT family transporter [Thermoleophilaceae bacterium]